MNFTKTILNGLKAWIINWVNNTFVSYKEQILSKTEKEQAQENIGIIAATDQDVIDLLLDMDMMPVVQDTDGTILVDSDNTIILT